MNETEITRIATFLGQSEADFITHETEVAPGRRSLMMRNTDDGACVWLDAHNRCRLHPVKPDKCRTFPFALTNADSAEICPGLKALQTKPL